MKRTVLLLFTLALLVPAATAQARNDHLEPALEPVFWQSPKSPPVEQRAGNTRVYFENLMTLLLDGFTASSRVCYIVTPSFRNEYAWSAECGENGECFLLVHRMVQNYWYYKNPEMSRQKVAISKPVYDSLKEVFEEVTARIRLPEQKTLIMDGVRYYFMYGDTGKNLRVGYTHSPAPESLMNRLTAVCEKIMEAPVEASAFEREIQAELKAILEEIRKQPRTPQLTYMEKSSPELLRQLKAQKPTTHQVLAELGFSGLRKESFSNGAHYTGTNILLNDEVFIEKVQLRERNGGFFLVFDLAQCFWEREDIEAEFGPFRLFAGPHGKSESEEITYISDALDDFIIMIGLAQRTHRIKELSISNRK